MFVVIPVDYGLKSSPVVNDFHLHFGCDYEKGTHAARICARAKALKMVGTSRLDSEGIVRVDLEASSHKEWSEWVKDLVPHKRTMLSVWRGGAARTPTRR